MTLMSLFLLFYFNFEVQLKKKNDFKIHIS